jgi:hypothetical protein
MSCIPHGFDGSCFFHCNNCHTCNLEKKCDSCGIKCCQTTGCWKILNQNDKKCYECKKRYSKNHNSYAFSYMNQILKEKTSSEH